MGGGEKKQPQTTNQHHKTCKHSNTSNNTDMKNM
jgi:hypothetical protein